jgi:hypothetical protein
MSGYNNLRTTYLAQAIINPDSNDPKVYLPDINVPTSTALWLDGDSTRGFFLRKNILNASDTLEISFNTTVTDIPTDAFAQITHLVKVTIGSNIINIGKRAFYGCTNLETLIINGNTNGTNIGIDAFNNLTKLVNVTISNIGTIGQYAFALTGITDLDVPDTVTSLGDGVFSQTKLKNITIGSNNLTRIPNNTFSRCKDLENVVISDHVTTIGTSAFNEISLNKIIIPNSVTTIEDYAFYQSSIEEIVMSSEIEYIGYGAFQNIPSLSTVTFAFEDPGPGQYQVTTFNNISNNTIDRVPSVNGLGQTISYSPYSFYDDDFTVIYYIFGCTNPKASNYSELANNDDNSCVIIGCKDVRFEEYDPDVTQIDDSYCVTYYGCTDRRAINYISEATFNDNSCEYIDSNGNIPNFNGYSQGVLSLAIL